MVDEIVDEAQPADVDKASSFRASFLSPDGVTAAKLKRMENAEWKHCEEELETSLERIRAGTPAAQALVRPLPSLLPPASSSSLMSNRSTSPLTRVLFLQPSVDLLLLRAHDVAQTPEDRLAIFTHCVDNLLKLYQQRHLPHVTHEQHLDYLRSARETLLNEVEATSFVRHLPSDRQQAAVRLVRERLYSACWARMSGDGLPLLRSVVRRPPSSSLAPAGASRLPQPDSQRSQINDLCTAVMVDIDPSTSSRRRTRLRRTLLTLLTSTASALSASRLVLPSSLSLVVAHGDLLETATRRASRFWRFVALSSERTSAAVRELEVREDGAEQGQPG